MKQAVLFLWVMIVCFLPACKRAYEPAVLNQPNQFLVVNGVINTAVNGQTHINLSRTRNLEDTVIFHPERGATIYIEGEAGQRFEAPAVNDSGDYVSSALSLSASERYRLSIQTNDGSHYQSEFVHAIQTPPIDSISWQQPNDIFFFVNTHDPAGNARFYRWDFVETWEYTAQLLTPWHLENHLLTVADDETQTSKCWISQFSKDIIMANSAALGEDRISMQPLHEIPNADPRINYRYSLLVNQYALTPEAYNYWQIVKKNSQQLGTLFDQMPSQLIGNLVCLDRPAELVLGYVSATAVQSKRLFVDRRELNDWPQTFPGEDCKIIYFDYNPFVLPVFNNPDDSYTVYYFVSGGPAVMGKRTCLDCRLKGGSNQKPSFW